MSRRSVLRSIYYNVEHPAGYSSNRKLFEAAREYLPDLTVEEVDEWLRGETSYTLHHQARHRFPRNRTIAHGEGEWCQADLADMRSYASANNRMRYLVTFIDVFTKRATAVPVKSKTMGDVSHALDLIFKNFSCRNLLTDRGLEFDNEMVKAVVNKYDVRLVFAYNEAVKASVVERFNRTLKTRMHKYFTAKGTRRYIDVLDSLLYSYNHSVHSSTGMRPVDVNAENTGDVFTRLYGFESEREMILEGPTEVARFQVNDLVRVRYHLSPMEKSYLPTFSDQVFTVTAVVPDHPNYMYRLKNWAGDTLDRKYYAHDLLRVSQNVKFRVEKVLKRRGNLKFVKWVGYPPEANSWVRNLSDV